MKGIKRPSNQAPTVTIELNSRYLAMFINGLKQYIARKKANFKRRKKEAPGEAACLAMELSDVRLFIDNELMPKFADVNKRTQAWTEEWRQYNEAQKQ